MGVPTIDQLRYVVLSLDTKHKDFEGRIYKSYLEVKEFASENLSESYHDKIIVGSFILEPEHEYMEIFNIHTFGFKGDSKDVNQLDIFSI